MKHPKTYISEWLFPLCHRDPAELLDSLMPILLAVCPLASSGVEVCRSQSYSKKIKAYYCLSSSNACSGVWRTVGASLTRIPLPSLLLTRQPCLSLVFCPALPQLPLHWKNGPELWQHNSSSDARGLPGLQVCVLMHERHELLHNNSRHVVSYCLINCPITVVHFLPQQMWRLHRAFPCELGTSCDSTLKRIWLSNSNHHHLWNHNVTATLYISVSVCD